MSKIAYFSAPAHGHVNPTLPVVQELAQRGEQVIFYNAEEFRPQVEATGAAFRAYPPTKMTSAAIGTAVQDGNLANVSALILSATETLLPFALDELRREQADLVIFDSLALWGKTAATLLNTRAAASISHFVFDTGNLMEGGTSRRIFLRYLGQALPKVPGIILARIRLQRRFGKAAFSNTASLFPLFGGLNIMFTSRALQPDTSLIDETFRFVGPSINPQMRGEAFPFEALGEGTVVYISLGTIHHTRTEFYKRCIEAFGGYPAQFILSAGRDTGIAALGAIPANFIVRPSVPQLDVLQRTDVFITHGGLNSVHEGLYYGVPLIVIPHQIEQLINARCVEKQGAA